MTKVNIEVLDSNSVDAGYYGEFYVARIVTMYKPGGSSEHVLSKLNEAFDAVRAWTERSNHYAADEQTIHSDSLKTKRMINSLHSAGLDLKQSVEEQVAKLYAQNAKLESLIAQSNKLKQQLKTIHDRINNLEPDFDLLRAQYGALVDKLLFAIRTDRIAAFDKLLGSADFSRVLYDHFIEDGWEVIESPLVSINHIDYTDKIGVVPIPTTIEPY